MPSPTRRRFLGAGIAAAVAPLALAANGPPPAVIDAHTHFYDPTRPQGVPWPGKGNAALYRRVLPADYKELAKPHGVTGTVVVEASPWVDDNRWLLELAKDEPFVTGVVGRLLPADADFAANLARFAKDPLFRGVRITGNEVRDALRTPAHLDSLKALSDAGLTLDVNGGTDTLLLVPALAEKLPKLHVVLNHLANVAVDGKEPLAAWTKAMAAAAGPTVWCKLSGLVEGSGKKDRKAPTDAAFFRPVLEAAWAGFGADKLLFGSNWPVSDQYAPFANVIGLAADYAKGKGAFDKVFGGNATAAYRLKPR